MSDLAARLRKAHAACKGARLTLDDVAEVLAVLNFTVEGDLRDPVTPMTAEAVRLDQPLERAAIVVELWGWNVPEQCPMMLSRNEAEVRERWAKMDAALVRNLNRRRAKAMLDAYSGRT